MQMIVTILMINFFSRMLRAKAIERKVRTNENFIEEKRKISRGARETERIESSK